MINIAWDDIKTDGVSTFPASEYNDLVAAAKHTQAQSAKWAVFDTATNYVFKVAATNRMTISYASSVTTVSGGGTTGDDIVIKANTVDLYPKIVFQGNSTLDLYSSTTIKLYASAANYAQLGVSGSDFQVTALGSNNNVALVPNGTGLVKFGTYTVKAAEVHTGYFTMLDQGGTSRKVMICA